MCLAGCGPGMIFASDPIAALVLGLIAVAVLIANVLSIRQPALWLLTAILAAAALAEYTGALPSI